jgi:mRNA degradation ribonuclease J1/J2
VCEVGEEALAKTAPVRAGRVHVVASRALPASALSERMALASRGVAHVVVPVDARGMPGELTLVTSGVLDPVGDAALLAAARRDAEGAVLDLMDAADTRARASGTASNEEIADAAASAVRRCLGKELGFRPVTTATVLRTAG